MRLFLALELAPDLIDALERARVVWIGVEHDARLELLHHDLEIAGETEGFESFESTLAEAGATYRRLHAATLGGR